MLPPSQLLCTSTPAQVVAVRAPRPLARNQTGWSWCAPLGAGVLEEPVSPLLLQTQTRLSASSRACHTGTPNTHAPQVQLPGPSRMARVVLARGRQPRELSVWNMCTQADVSCFVQVGRFEFGVYEAEEKGTGTGQIVFDMVTHLAGLQRACLCGWLGQCLQRPQSRGLRPIPPGALAGRCRGSVAPRPVPLAPKT